MLETQIKIEGFNIFQLRDLNKLITQRMTLLGLPTLPITADAPRPFRRGDLIEFYSPRDHKQLRCVVDRVNGKSLSVHVKDAPHTKWRVSPGLAKLVDLSKVVELALTVVDKTTDEAADFEVEGIHAYPGEFAHSSTIPTHESAITGVW